MIPDAIKFGAATDKKTLEDGAVFAPRFDASGLIPAVAVDDASGDVMMLAYMNEAALRLTLATGEAHYFSRSRNEIWHKGASSGQIQRVVSIATDCDQNALLLRVVPQGDGKCCHTGRTHCFYRRIEVAGDGATRLSFIAR